MTARHAAATVAADVAVTDQIRAYLRDVRLYGDTRMAALQTITEPGEQNLVQAADLTRAALLLSRSADLFASLGVVFE